jgi:zinc transport system substrate-binding protein
MNPPCQSTKIALSLKGLLIAILALTMQQVSAAPRVAATIKPLQLIAAAITEGISEPVQILGAGQDPHEFALRPSERRALGDADVLLWIGPALEQPLANLVASLDAEVITLQDAPGIGVIETDLGIDPHLWLSPQAATGIAGILAATLAGRDAENAAGYRRNQEAFTSQMEALRSRIDDRLAGLQQTWVVDHYAYRYFVEAFDLPEPLVLRESDNREPGMRTVARLRQAMQTTGVNCIVAEPGANAAELRTLLGNPDLRVMVADPMGQDVEANAFAYATLLADIAQSISICMGASDE